MQSRTSDELLHGRTLPTIDSIDVVEVRIPRERNRFVSGKFGTSADAHHLIIRIHADGLIGLGEAPGDPWWTGDDAAMMRIAVEQYLAPSLLGKNSGIREAVESLDVILGANYYAKAGVELALWDLMGQVAQLPLSALLAGGPGHPLPIKYTIGAINPSAAGDAARFAMEAGFSHLKLKVGGDLSDDLERVSAVVDAINGYDSNACVGVDANGGWSMVNALWALKPLEEMRVSFLEQPVSAKFPRNMAEVTFRSSIPVMAHDSLITVEDGLRAAAERTAHIWVLTPTAHGILKTLQLLSIARAHGIPCVLGSSVELGVGTALLAQLGSAFEDFALAIPSDAMGPFFNDDDVISHPARIEQGFLHAPAGPGLGVELDEERLAKYSLTDGS